MNARNTRIPDAIDDVAHCFGSQRRFLGDGNITRAGSHDCDRADALIGVVAANSYQTSRLVPLGVSNDVANLAERAFVGASDQDVWRARGEPVDDTDDLSRSEERRVGKECRSRWSPH